MLGLLSMLSPSYIIESEREADIGRADIVLLPKVDKNNNAIIIEYKVAKPSENLQFIAKTGRVI